ncbi:MAG: bifunctional 5,10-methylenetetrahydrofolate dehydrogenase/5,10-methenyltetrahydrofolate cyclohydrolase [Phycisphaerales bacterium]|nr:bifunctional 5,10-methylenetetrahydrofolate dehydrogenase/5,10-methenyltetrahydrofolate cyclohydrolase [Phycisphaerales bacterium]
MPARIIDGRALADSIRRDIAARTKALRSKGRSPRLDAVLVGSADNASRLYAHNQGKTCAELGIEYKLHEIAGEPGETPAEVFDHIAGRVLLLNTQPGVSGIMVHMPLPEGIDPYLIQRLIDPDKDVEGVNPANIGNIVYGRSSLAPCTGLAAVKMIESVLAPTAAPANSENDLRGKLAVVIGASDVVGKPIAVMLMRRDATVVSCNKWTPGLADLTRRADILVAAVGKADLITADMVKPGAIVIDVGVNRVPGPDGKSRTVGDVCFDAVRERLGDSGWISPVPGGVGPMTVAMLLLNVVEAAERA